MFSSNCSVQCGFDANRQAAVEEYFVSLKTFFDSNSTTTTTRCTLLITGFEDSFPSIHEFLVGNQNAYELNNEELSEGFVRSWFWECIRLAHAILLVYPSY